MNIVHGTTALLAVVDDDWYTTISTLNVSLGKLIINAFDKSCNVNTDEDSDVSLLLYHGQVPNCTLAGNAHLQHFFGHNTTARFKSGFLNFSSLYLEKPKSGFYSFCICTSHMLCASKIFKVEPGTPVDLVLNNISLASSYSRSGSGLSPSSSDTLGLGNAYIEFVVSAFDINGNKVVDSNHSITVLVQAQDGMPQYVVLRDYSNNVASPKHNLSEFIMPQCNLGSSKCKFFMMGIRGAVYSLKISLSNSYNRSSDQLSSYRHYVHHANELIPLANFSYPNSLFSSTINLSKSEFLNNRKMPSLSFERFQVAPCNIDSQMAISNWNHSDSNDKFGRCQCRAGYRQDDFTDEEKKQGYGDTIKCTACVADQYQPDAGQTMCIPCPTDPSKPSSTLSAIGQISNSSCKCAPNSLYVRITKLETTSSDANGLPTSVDVTEVCQGLYGSRAAIDCFCLACDSKKQTCFGGSAFWPISVISNSSSSGGSSAIALSSVSGASQLAAAFSFYNNSAYYAFLSNSTKLNNTVSPLITAYKSSSAAIACRPLGTGQYPCLGQTVGRRQVLEGSQCEKGYTGFLCSSCATYVDEIYEKSSGNTCILCEKKEQSVYVFLALLLLLSIVLVCLYFIGEARKPQSVKNKYSIGTKTFLNHLQVLSFMGDLQSSWSDLIRSMFGIANLSNLGFSIGNVGCSIKLTFQEKLILYCMSPFIISLAPMFFYMLQCLACYRKLLADTRRRIRFARNHQNDHALYNLDKGHDLDWIQSRYSLEETELLHLTLTWKEHLRKFKTQINERKNTITPEDAIMLRYKLGKELLKKQFFTDSVVVLMVVTFLLFSTISRQIFYTFSVRVYDFPQFSFFLSFVAVDASYISSGTNLTYRIPVLRIISLRSWNRSLIFSLIPNTTKKLGSMP
jgi:hypothetical protein